MKKFSRLSINAFIVFAVMLLVTSQSVNAQDNPPESAEAGDVKQEESDAKTLLPPVSKEGAEDELSEKETRKKRMPALPDERINLLVGHAYFITDKKRMKQVDGFNTNLIEVRGGSPTKVQLIGKLVGTTDLVVRFEDESSRLLRIIVQAENKKQPAKENDSSIDHLSQTGAKKKSGPKHSSHGFVILKGRSDTLSTKSAVRSIKGHDPSVVDAVAVYPNGLGIFGKAVGETDIHIELDDGSTRLVRVYVQSDEPKGFEAIVKRLFPDAKLEIVPIQDSAVFLRGTVATAEEVEQVEKIAEEFWPSVHNYVKADAKSDTVSATPANSVGDRVVTIPVSELTIPRRYLKAGILVDVSAKITNSQTPSDSFYRQAFVEGVKFVSLNRKANSSQATITLKVTPEQAEGFQVAMGKKLQFRISLRGGKSPRRLLEGAFDRDLLRAFSDLTPRMLYDGDARPASSIPKEKKAPRISLGSPAELPTTGSPIGLPGPPHIPLRQPARVPDTNFLGANHPLMKGRNKSPTPPKPKGPPTTQTIQPQWPVHTFRSLIGQVPQSLPHVIGPATVPQNNSLQSDVRALHADVKRLIDLLEKREKRKSKKSSEEKKTSLIPRQIPKKGKAVLFFTASWCGPCQEMQPIVQKLMREGYAIFEVDVDQDKELANKFHITKLPTFIQTNGGQLINGQRQLGAMSEEELRRFVGNFTKGDSAKNPPAPFEANSSSPDPFAAFHKVEPPPAKPPVFEIETGQSMLAPDVTVAVVCSAPAKLKLKHPNFNELIAQSVAHRLTGNQVTTIAPGYIESWIKEHPDWKKAEEIGKAFKADYVIEIDLTNFSLYQHLSTALYRGHAEGAIHVVQMDKPNRGNRIFTKKLDFAFPKRVPMDASVQSEEAFKKTYISYLSDIIRLLFSDPSRGFKRARNNVELILPKIKRVRENKPEAINPALVDQRDGLVAIRVVERTKPGGQNNAEGAIQHGTGFVIGHRTEKDSIGLRDFALVLTCAHVLRVKNGEPSIQVVGLNRKGVSEMNDGYGVTVVASDSDLDLALLKIKLPEESALSRQHTFALEQNLKVGEQVNWLGFHAGKSELTRQQGVIATLNKYGGPANFQVEKIMATQGMSGSPVLNDNGEVVGIVTAVDKEEEETVCTSLTELQGFLETHNIRVPRQKFITPLGITR